MPFTVAQLLGSASLSSQPPVRWGTRVPSTKPGIYIVSSAKTPDEYDRALLAEAPISLGAVADWIETVPTLTLNGVRPTPQELADHLAGFWLPDEVVLYIGKAACLRRRLYDFYRTQLGARRPHRGGHWLKTLSILNELTVFWTETQDVETAEYLESRLLKTFAAGVSESTRKGLFDPDHPFPYANLEIRDRKRHSIRESKLP